MEPRPHSRPEESLMATFADRMTSFTEHLAASIQQRDEALNRVHQATEGLLAGAGSSSVALRTNTAQLPRNNTSG